MPQDNVFNGSGYGGANISPEFRWSAAPSGTKSFAITIFDPDAPTRGGWWHSVIFNIPATVAELPAGAGNDESRRFAPTAVQCRNDYGEPGYGGPVLRLDQPIDIWCKCMHSTLRVAFWLGDAAWKNGKADRGTLYWRRQTNGKAWSVNFTPAKFVIDAWDGPLTDPF